MRVFARVRVRVRVTCARVCMCAHNARAGMRVCAHRRATRTAGSQIWGVIVVCEIQ